MIVAPGSTDITTYFVLRKAADGTELTGATITNIDLVYTRSGADHVAKVGATALATPDAAHADNQAIEVDATSAPGLYRVDWPDAAFAAGAREVVLTMIYATAFSEHLRVELLPWQTPITGATVRAVNASDAALSTLGGTAQTGDVYAQVGVAGAGLTALGDTRLANLDAAVSSRAVAGDAMALTGAERTTLTAAIVAGLTAATAYLAAVAAAVWAYATRTLTSIAALGADVWTYATRTLTQSAASVTSTVSGSTITATRGDTLSASLTGLGNISAHSKLWVAVKADPDNDADTAAILLIEKTAGLTVVNGAPHATITNGSIVVTNETTGAITITVKPAVTALLAGGAYRYDVQMLTAAGVVQTLTTANFVVDVTTDVTRVVS